VVLVVLVVLLVLLVLMRFVCGAAAAKCGNELLLADNFES
jgi:hypothetical protein